MNHGKHQELKHLIDSSFDIIAPFWPLKNLIAVNPLRGFEDLPFKKALEQAEIYFQQNHIPEPMHVINRFSMKWLQAYFDLGQSTINMPNQDQDLWVAVKPLLLLDGQLPLKKRDNRRWLESLSEEPLAVIDACLARLDIATANQSLFLKLLLTTLPGWAAHVQYQINWSAQETAISAAGYLAFRLVLTCLLWPQAKELLTWFTLIEKEVKTKRNFDRVYNQLIDVETRYRNELILKLKSQAKPALQSNSLLAQLVFCIDVRSEPYRRAIEAQGAYETFGFAGFFGLPIAVQSATGSCYSSCPVLLQPEYTVGEYEVAAQSQYRQQLFGLLKHLYYCAKYTFSAPLGLSETLGLLQGLWMFAKAVWPRQATTTKQRLSQSDGIKNLDIESIPLSKRVEYAKQLLQAIGLTRNFAPLVMLCGHGSTTTNNAYDTALDCGACGGHRGGINAQVMATILNEPTVRYELTAQGIAIPLETIFLAAEHDTTTDEMFCYDSQVPPSHRLLLQQIKTNLATAQVMNNLQRADLLGLTADDVVAQTQRLANDWSEMRPEWGLARNAAFIIGPRWATKNLNLDGRCFLHSYEAEQDLDGAVLTAIMTAPMVVAQWINNQYLFSTLDKIAFGGGNKITANVVAKIGVMQGNSSDLMTGLSLQSVYATDDKPFHEAMRLQVVVFAPQSRVDAVIAAQPSLQKLIGNGWVNLMVVEPKLADTAVHPFAL